MKQVINKSIFVQLGIQITGFNKFLPSFVTSQKFYYIKEILQLANFICNQIYLIFILQFYLNFNYKIN